MTNEELKRAAQELREESEFISRIRMSEADIAEYRALRKVSEMFERLLMAREERYGEGRA